MEIDSILFGILSADEIIRTSVAKISVNKMTGGEGTVYDERMGPEETDDDSKKNCLSCGRTHADCPGHFGHIELNYPIPHPMYYRLIVNFLKCFCFKCYSFLLTEDHLKLDNIHRYNSDARFTKILDKMEKTDVCYHCEEAKSKVIFVASESNIYQVYKKTRILMTENEIKKIFDNVSDDDVKLLGFNPSMTHPRNLILTALPVLPPISRPYVIADSTMCDDDLTIQYLEIIKANNHLEEAGLPESKQQKHVQTLKFRIKTLMNNGQGKARHTNGRAIKCIKSRISGKDGLIRNNLMGKRVNQSGRTVIGPDPTVGTDEVVVPEKMAEILTKPERVTRYNIEELTRIVNTGQAKFVLKNNGQTRINLKYVINRMGTEVRDGDVVIRGAKEINPGIFKNFRLQEGDVIRRGDEEIRDIILPEKKFYRLQIGDIVERNLRNGDIILFNRQPTLHAGSMLAKRVVVRPGNTLRFNLAATKTFNADFDGDRA